MPTPASPVFFRFRLGLILGFIPAYLTEISHLIEARKGRNKTEKNPNLL